MCILRFYVPVDLFVSLFGNDPAMVKVSGDTIIIDPDAKTEDGYAFEYSFGTIYADSPAMSIDTQLLSIVLTSAEEQGPRDIQVGDELSIVLEANYSENPSLCGSRESAVLYVLDLLPESMRWGEVKRDGQRVQTVEYAVHERVETDGEGYTDTGVHLYDGGQYRQRDSRLWSVRAHDRGGNQHCARQSPLRCAL